MTASANLPTQLLRYYQSQIPEIKRPKISHFAAVSDGWETRIFAYTLDHKAGRDERILRIYPGDDALDKSKREFEGMRQLLARGYPVPEAFIHEAAAAWFGSPFIIVQRIHGHSLWTAMEQAPPERKSALIAQFCRLMADLHGLDPRPFVTPEFAGHDLTDPFLFLRLRFAEWRAFLHNLGHHDFDPVIAWLEDRMENAPCRRLSVTHGDFHAHNVLLTGSGRAFVIDWTNIGVGDYRYDLAWTLLLHGAYNGPAERDQILAEYRRLAGAPVENLAYFEVIALARRVASMALSILGGPNTMGMRPEAVAVMRQQREHLHAVYTGLKERTGIALATVEHLLDQL